jgi:TRAP-type C4-dicarboxylate transport system substrate-binding protein
LGAAFSVIPAAESYTSMERGVVDGYNYPIENHVDMGLHEAGKYLIDHGFFCDNVVALMSLKVWKGLSPDLQKVVKEAQIAVEKEMEASYWDTVDKSRKKMLDAKVKFVKFSPADAKKYLDAYYKNQLAEQKEKFPNVVPRLSELLGW